MSEKKIKPGDLGRALKREAAFVRSAMERGTMAAARRFRAHMAEATDKRGITDRGILKNSWTAAKLGTSGAQVYSDVPYAGIIELGARPHKVSRAGIEAIAGWVKRKMMAPKGPIHERIGKGGKVTRRMPRGKTSDEEAISIAYAIAKKIEREGQKPMYLVRGELPFAEKYLAQEVDRILSQRAAKGTP